MSQSISPCIEDMHQTESDNASYLFLVVPICAKAGLSAVCSSYFSLTCFHVKAVEAVLMSTMSIDSHFRGSSILFGGQFAHASYHIDEAAWMQLPR